jgi:membrane protease YdiL (CAAX protease family)
MVCTDYSLLMPAMLFLSYWVVYLVGLPPLPQSNIPLLYVLVLFPVFFITAIGEEVGWLGYAIDPMQDSWGALYASMILGIVWALWHPLGIYSNQQRARMGNMAVSWFDTFTNSYSLDLQQHRKEHIGWNFVSCYDQC